MPRFYSWILLLSIQEVWGKFACLWDRTTAPEEIRQVGEEGLYPQSKENLRVGTLELKYQSQQLKGNHICLRKEINSGGSNEWSFDSRPKCVLHRKATAKKSETKQKQMLQETTGNAINDASQAMSQNRGFFPFRSLCSNA